jgi:tetratricopeptide (TPR) repeat protein
MPRIAAHDVPHTSQTDHRVVRESGAEQRAAGDSRVLSVFGSASGRVPEPEIERARHVLIVGLAEGEPRYRRAAAAAVPPLRAWWTAAPEDLVAAEALAGAFVLNNDTANAVQTLERVLALNPDSEKALWRLATIRHEQGSTEQAVKHTRRLVELNPWNHANLAGLAYLLGCVGRYGEGIDAAERALELNPSAIELHGWLGEAYAIQGDQQRSAFHRDLFHRLSAGR